MFGTNEFRCDRKRSHTHTHHMERFAKTAPTVWDKKLGRKVWPLGWMDAWEPSLYKNFSTFENGCRVLRLPTRHFEPGVGGHFDLCMGEAEFYGAVGGLIRQEVALRQAGRMLRMGYYLGVK